VVKDRRAFLQETIGKVLQEVAERTEERVAPRRYFRPPGAAPEVEFLASCTRCGDCIDVCPVHAIVKAPATAGTATQCARRSRERPKKMLARAPTSGRAGINQTAMDTAPI